MIRTTILRSLVREKLRYTDVLFNYRRYSAAMYVSGYALELALKYKICKIFCFNKGLPEDKTEFSVYASGVKTHDLLQQNFMRIKDIKNHNLNKLLFYSGEQYQINMLLLTQWKIASSWNPEMRYELRKHKRQDALNVISAVKTIVNFII